MWTLTVLLATSSIAQNLDFRGVQLGDSCEAAADREIQHKAVPLQPVNQMLQNGILAFNDASIPDEPQTVLYGCTNGKVDHYLIKTVVHDGVRAHEKYTHTKSELWSRFGPPKTDSDTYNDTQKKLLAGLNLSEVAHWQVNDAALDVARSFGVGVKQGEWDVTVSVSSARRRKESAEGGRTVVQAGKSRGDAEPSRCEEYAVVLNVVSSRSSGTTRWGWRVYPGSDSSGFQQLGFMPGDLIWEIDGRPISPDDDFFSLVLKPGGATSVLLSLQRDGSSQQLRVESATAAAVLHGCK